MKRLLVIGIAAIVGIASHGVADAQNVTYTDCITPAGHPTIVPRGTRCPSGASSWEGATPARSARAAAAGMSDASLYEAEALDRMMGISPGHGFAPGKPTVVERQIIVVPCNPAYFNGVITGCNKSW